MPLGFFSLWTVLIGPPHFILETQSPVQRPQSKLDQSCPLVFFTVELGSFEVIQEVARFQLTPNLFRARHRLS